MHVALMMCMLTFERHLTPNDQLPMRTLARFSLYVVSKPIVHVFVRLQSRAYRIDADCCTFLAVIVCGLERQTSRCGTSDSCKTDYVTCEVYTVWSTSRLGQTCELVAKALAHFVLIKMLGFLFQMSSA